MSRKAKRKPGNTSGYKIRKDHQSDKRMLTAVLFFGGTMLGLLAAALWLILSPNGQGGVAPPAQSLAVFIMLFCVFASVVNCFVAVGKLHWFYRCPSCGQRLTRPRGEYGPIQYRCDSCKTRWDTDWERDIAD